MTKNEDFEKLRIKIIVRAWKDPSFKAKLLKNPKATLKEMGWDLPEQFQVKVVEDQKNSYTFVLPPAVAQAETLSSQELEKIAGGVGPATARVGCKTDARKREAC